MNAEVAQLVAERGLLGIASRYLKDLQGMERSEATIKEIRLSLRAFLRWLAVRQGQEPGTRLDPVLLSVNILREWWDWMLSPERVVTVPVQRHGRTYLRTYPGPLARASAYNAWARIRAFWRWAAQVSEIPKGVVPTCETERLKKRYHDPNKPRGARSLVRAATWPEAARCVAEVPDWVRPVVVICYYTGLRVKQARELTWEDVHLDGYWADQHEGPVLWIGHGKTAADRRGRHLPLHPALRGWLRRRRVHRGCIEDLPGDLRRVNTKSYKARVQGLAEGRIAWEAGNQPLGSQLQKAWARAGVDRAVWERRTAHAFRKAVRTNVMQASDIPGARVWQAAERLLGHELHGEIDTYQDDRALMPTMRKLIESIPRWEDAAERQPDNVIPLRAGVAEVDLEALV